MALDSPNLDSDCLSKGSRSNVPASILNRVTIILHAGWYPRCLVVDRCTLAKLVLFREAQTIHLVTMIHCIQTCREIVEFNENSASIRIESSDLQLYAFGQAVEVECSRMSAINPRHVGVGNGNMKNWVHVIEEGINGIVQNHNLYFQHAHGKLALLLHEANVFVDPGCRSRM